MYGGIYGCLVALAHELAAIVCCTLVHLTLLLHVTYEPCVCAKARWLIGLLTGTMALPPVEEQLADVVKMKGVNRGFIGYPEKGNFVATQYHAYHDQVIGDLGRSPFTKVQQLRAFLNLCQTRCLAHVAHAALLLLLHGLTLAQPLQSECGARF